MNYLSSALKKRCLVHPFILGGGHSLIICLGPTPSSAFFSLTPTDSAPSFTSSRNVLLALPHSVLPANLSQSALTDMFAVPPPHTSKTSPAQHLNLGSLQLSPLSSHQCSCVCVSPLSLLLPLNLLHADTLYLTPRQTFSTCSACTCFFTYIF